MKKTIASIAILAASTSAQALISPGQGHRQLKTYCLEEGYTQEDGSQSIGNCDASRNNIAEELELKENGCAEGQVSLKTFQDLKIFSCMPPGAVQL